MCYSVLEAVERGLYLLEVFERSEALEVLEVMRHVLVCMFEAVDGELCLLQVPKMMDVMRCVLVCMMEAVGGGLCLLEVSEVMRCVLLCMLEVPENIGGDVLCALSKLKVPVMRCVLCVYWRLWSVRSVCWRCSRCRTCRR